MKVEKRRNESFLAQQLLYPLAQILNLVTGFKIFDTQLPERIVSVESRQFKLTSITETTPLNIVQSKLQLGQYEEALSIAKQYSLSQDSVFKHQWMNTRIKDVDLIKKVLHRIQDVHWQIQQCISTVCCNVEPQLYLCNYGISLTNVLDELCSSEGDTDLQSRLDKVVLTKDQSDNDELRLLTFCQQRFCLLRCLDKLQTLECLLRLPEFKLVMSDYTFTQLYAEWSQLSLQSIAGWMAERQTIESICILLTRHKSDISVDDLLSIIDHLPEVCSLDSSQLLVDAYRDAPLNFRDKDWVEYDQIKQQLQLQKDLNADNVQIDNDLDELIIQNRLKRSLNVDFVTNCTSIALEFAEEQNKDLRLIGEYLYDMNLVEFKDVDLFELPDKSLFLQLDKFLKLPLKDQILTILERGILRLQTFYYADLLANDLQRHLSHLQFDKDGIEYLVDHLSSMCCKDVKAAKSLFQKLSTINKLKQPYAFEFGSYSLEVQRVVDQILFKCTADINERSGHLAYEWLSVIDDLINRVIALPFDKQRIQLIKLILTGWYNVQMKDYESASLEVETLLQMTLKGDAELQYLSSHVALQLVNESRYKDYETKVKIIAQLITSHTADYSNYNLNEVMYAYQTLMDQSQVMYPQSQQKALKELNASSLKSAIYMFT
ncbi:hypothetical protein MP228_010534 [Amoeboaphelidium protococcarum]|nr:hypothetical protein MP228_010534 [Amoeboaphelidium protococcarum]